MAAAAATNDNDDPDNYATARIHYVGWLMHRNDFRRGAGGFLSGYRYLIRNLVHHVREVDHGVPYPRHDFDSVEDVLDHAAMRFQIASDLVVLQDGVAVRDVILPVIVASKDDDDNDQSGGEVVHYHYYEGVTYSFHRDLFEQGQQQQQSQGSRQQQQQHPPIYLYLAWGDGRTAATVFDHVYLFNNTHALRNIMLHPVVEVNGLVRETQEDLDMAWRTEEFVPPIKRILREALAHDYAKFHPKSDHSYRRAEYDRPREHHPYETGRRGGDGTHFARALDIARRAAKLGGEKGTSSAEVVEFLRSQAATLVPTLTSSAVLGARADDTGDDDVGPSSGGNRRDDEDGDGSYRRAAEPGAANCVPGGHACGSFSGSPACCDGKTCAQVSDAGLSFCVALGM